MGGGTTHLVWQKTSKEAAAPKRRGGGGRVHGSQLGGNSCVSPQKPTRDRGWCKSWVRTTGEEGVRGWGREPARGPTGRFPARTPLSRSHGEGLGHSSNHAHTHRGRHRVAPREPLLLCLQPDPQAGPACCQAGDRPRAQSEGLKLSRLTERVTPGGESQHWPPGSWPKV